MTDADTKKGSVEPGCDRGDFLYYRKYDFEHLFDGYTGEDGYMAFQTWPGGFNNIRMSFEMLVCFAYLTNRTMVLPPTGPMYLVEGESHLSDFFQLDDLGVSSVLFEDFCESKGIRPEMEELMRISTRLHEGFHDRFVPIVFNFLSPEQPASELVKGREVVPFGDFFDDSELVFFDRNVFGNFYQSIVSARDLDLKRLIARHVHYRPDIFELAHHFIRQLEGEPYAAIHIRRNDFQYDHVIKDASEIRDNIWGSIPEGSRLYVSTDHMDKAFFHSLGEVYDLCFYSDLVDQVDEDVPVNWLPLVEQLICTRAFLFVGQDLSTFSNYIFRLRGYMDDVENKDYYLGTEPFDAGRQLRFAEDRRFSATWTREYRDVFELE